MSTTNRFATLVAKAKENVREVSPEDAQREAAAGAKLIDVREADEFARQSAPGAIHLSKGVLELKIEDAVPDTGTPIICYCGGGSRSALAAESLQRMGYTNVASMAGGFKAWKAQNLPTS